MRLTFLGHACHLVEVGGARILTDPWLCDPIFGGHVERDPPLGFGIADLPAVDAIALTHAHLDHFNAPTLARWPDKSLPVLLPIGRFTELEANLRLLGFSNLHALGDWQCFELGSARLVATPAPGVLDECAYFIAGPDGSFWDGADAPQPPALMREIAERLGPVTLGAFGHNSFDQPALLGLPSHKPADHGPLAAATSAQILGVEVALAAASNMRWTGPRGDEVTRKVIRRRPADFQHALARLAPDARFLDLRPGDAWSREGGIERGALRGRPEARVASDFIHASLEGGARFTPDGPPELEASFRRDLPARLRAVPEASRYLGRPVSFVVTGAESGTWTVDFRDPTGTPVTEGDAAPFAVELLAADWRALFERRISWQVLLVSDRLRVRRFRSGPPPDGLHFAYALQAVFP